MVLLKITSSVLTETPPVERDRSLGGRLAEHLFKVIFHDLQIYFICNFSALTSRALTNAVLWNSVNPFVQFCVVVGDSNSSWFVNINSEIQRTSDVLLYLVMLCNRFHSPFRLKNVHFLHRFCLCCDLACADVNRVVDQSQSKHCCIWSALGTLSEGSVITYWLGSAYSRVGSKLLVTWKYLATKTCDE